MVLKVSLPFGYVPEQILGHHGALLANISDLSTSAGYALEYNQGSFDLVLISDWNMPGGPGAIEAFTVKYYDPGVRHHVVASYDGSWGKGMGVNLYVDGNLEPAEIRTHWLNGEIRTDQRYFWITLEEPVL